jgi:hypothetical protein
MGTAHEWRPIGMPTRDSFSGIFHAKPESFSIGNRVFNGTTGQFRDVAIAFARDLGSSRIWEMSQSSLTDGIAHDIRHFVCALKGKSAIQAFVPYQREQNISFKTIVGLS